MSVSGFISVGLSLLVLGANASAKQVGSPDPEAVERGRDALLTRSFLSPVWGLETINQTSEFWEAGAPDPEESPSEFLKRFRQRYGLHSAPYPNDNLPMGLRLASPLESIEGETLTTGLQVDCLLCHGGSIGETSYVGLGNTQLDMIGLYRDLFRADGRPLIFTGFTVNTAKGTVNAGQMAVQLLSFRTPDLSRRLIPLPHRTKFPETDVPAWWLLKYKDTMYYDGRTDAQSVRSIMQFMMGELSREQFEDLEDEFSDIRAYLLSLDAPQYPFSIDSALASEGQTVFEANCAQCHGTYGEDSFYPNEIVPLEIIGTDPTRAQAPSELITDHYNRSWFGAKYPVDDEMVGYQAPPLEGIWATAPYLHNGSVPTLEHLLDSKIRPNRFRRPASTSFDHYDQNRVGWKFEELDPVPAEQAARDQDRTIFDTSRYGLGNQGHTFGDKLNKGERAAVIEYLKTL